MMERIDAFLDNMTKTFVLPFFTKTSIPEATIGKWFRILLTLSTLLSVASGLAIVALWAGMGTLCCPPCQKLMGKPASTNYAECKIDNGNCMCATLDGDNKIWTAAKTEECEYRLDTTMQSFGKCAICGIDAQTKSWRVVGDVIHQVFARCWKNGEESVAMCWKFTYDVLDITWKFCSDCFQMKYWLKPFEFLNDWFVSSRKMLEVICAFINDIIVLQFQCTGDVIAIGWNSTKGLQEMCFR